MTKTTKYILGGLLFSIFIISNLKIILDQRNYQKNKLGEQSVNIQNASPTESSNLYEIEPQNDNPFSNPNYGKEDQVNFTGPSFQEIIDKNLPTSPRLDTSSLYDSYNNSKLNNYSYESSNKSNNLDYGSKNETNVISNETPNYISNDMSKSYSATMPHSPPSNITNCDNAGCWGSDGTRYNRGAGDTYFPSNGGSCQSIGGQMQCN